MTVHIAHDQTETGDFALAAAFDILIPGTEQKAAETTDADAHQTCPCSDVTRNDIDVKFSITTQEAIQLKTGCWQCASSRWNRVEPRSAIKCRRLQVC